MRGVLMTDDGPLQWDEYSRSWKSRGELERRRERWDREAGSAERHQFDREAKRPQALELLEFAT